MSEEYYVDTIDEILDSISRENWIDQWEKFIRTFKDANGKYYYFDYFKNVEARGLTSFTLNYEDLVQTLELKGDDLGVDGGPMDCKYLRYLVLRQPDLAAETLKGAILHMMSENDEKHVVSIRHKFQAFFSNISVMYQPSEIKSDQIETMIRTEGTVIEYEDEPFSLRKKIVWKCERGHIFETKDVKGAGKVCRGMITLPDKKGHDTQVPCDGLPEVDAQRTRLYRVDIIRFKIQQRSDKTRQGKSAASIDIEVQGEDNVKYVLENVMNGNLVEINGIVRTHDTNVKRGNVVQNLGSLYIEASAFRVKNDVDEIEEDPTVSDLAKKIISPKTEKQDYTKIVNSIAPYIHFPDKDIIRKTILLLCVGGPKKKYPDKSERRGFPIVLMVGDPSTAKSTIMQYIQKVDPRATYSSGTGSSSVGLLGGYVDAGNVGVRKIAPGAIENANGSLCLIDEFADRSEQEMKDLAAVTSDDQVIKIIKGGSERKRKVHVGFLFVANPNTRAEIYDPNRSIYENLKKVPNKIIRRCDIVLVTMDIADDQQDEAKIAAFMRGESQSIVTSVGGNNIEEEMHTESGIYTIPVMREYIRYARTLEPEFTQCIPAVNRMKRWFNRYRKVTIVLPPDKNDSTQGPTTVTAVDNRKITTFARLCEARARACLRNYVTEEDAIEIEEILTQSLANTGFYINDNRPDSQRKMSADAEFLDKTFTAAALSQLSREKKLALQIYKAFTASLDENSWDRCGPCKGTGKISVRPGRTEYEDCEHCANTGWVKRSFSQDGVFNRLKDSKIADVNTWVEVWNEYIKKRIIIPDEEQPNRYKSTRNWINRVAKNLGDVKLDGLTLGDIDDGGDDGNRSSDISRKPKDAVNVIKRRPALWAALNKVRGDNT